MCNYSGRESSFRPPTTTGHWPGVLTSKVVARPAERRPQKSRGTGAPGQQVLFALLIQPDFLNAPVPTLAMAAGVTPAKAADRIVQLQREGLMHEGGDRNRLKTPRRLLDLWVKDYESLVRPKLLIGRYRAATADPAALEHLIESTLEDDTSWAFGGGAAARRLTGFEHGPETVVHVQQPGPDIAKLLRLPRAADGPLILLRAPGPLAFKGAMPRTVTPLLVYAELLSSGDKLAREAAGEIKRKYLWHLA
jgi:hypothetical protein